MGWEFGWLGWHSNLKPCFEVHVRVNAFSRTDFLYAMQWSLKTTQSLYFNSHTVVFTHDFSLAHNKVFRRFKGNFFDIWSWLKLPWTLRDSLYIRMFTNTIDRLQTHNHRPDLFLGSSQNNKLHDILCKLNNLTVTSAAAEHRLGSDPSSSLSYNTSSNQWSSREHS